MFRVRHCLPGILFWLAVSACSDPVSSPNPAAAAAGPVLVRVAAPDSARFLRKLNGVAGVWGVQRHPPDYILFMAPRPWPNTLAVLLGAYPHWDRPVRPAGRDARERRIFAVFDSLFEPVAPPPVAAQGVMPAQADALTPPDAELERAPNGLRPQSYSPVNYDRHTSEYLVGSIAVGLVLPESNGSKEPSTEDWTAPEVTTAVSQITQGLMAAQAACRGCGISFVVDLLDQHAPGAVSGTVDTDYEVVNHPFNDMNVNNNLLSRLGITGATQTDGFRQLANQLRAQHGTDWAVVVKMARNTAAGNMSYAPDPISGALYYSVTYLGGPFMALTLGNDTWGTSMLWSTFSHELNHAFYALDEYPAANVPPTNLAGYFKVGNAGSGFNDGAGFLGGAGENDPGCLMNHVGAPPYRYCAHTQGQIGWMDDDADGRPDVTQQPPAVSFTCASGTAAVNANYIYADFPPNFFPHRVGLGTIARVEYRINQLTWLPAAAQDGAFDGPSETFILAPSLPNGTYAVEARAIDNFGNVTSNAPRNLCSVSGSLVAAAAPFAAVVASPDSAALGQPLAFDASESSDLATYRRALQFRWDWNGDAAFDTSWSDDPKATHAFATAGTYAVVVEVKNAAGLSATRAVDVEILPLTNLPPVARLSADRQYASASATPGFVLSVQKSRDPEGAALSVRWDVDGDGSWDTPFSTALVTTATFSIGAAASGVWTVAAEVRDPAGNGSVAYLNLRAVAYDHAPVAALAPPSSLGGYAISLDASASSDTDSSSSWDQLVEFRWDFEGDGAFDTTYSTLPQISHNYARFGAFSPTVEVRDRFRVVSRRSRPVLLLGPAPSGLAVNQSDPLHPALSWNAVGGAAAYRIQVAADSSFAALVYEDRSVTPALSLPVMPAGSYFWRVSALTSYYDTVGFSAAASLVIAGPGATGLKILPVKPRTTDPLRAEFSLTGGASAPASRLYWTRDGRRVAALDGEKTVPAAETKKHEIWILVVSPSDGQRVGATAASSMVEIQNSAPSISAVSLRVDGEQLVCSPVEAGDDDGDELQYRYTWTRDGAALDEYGATLRAGAGEYGCAITPSDGEAEGKTVASAPQRIQAQRSDEGGGCNSSPRGAGGLGLVWGWLAIALGYRVVVTRRVASSKPLVP